MYGFHRFLWLMLTGTPAKAKLFHESTELKMVSTKPIRAGEQIVGFIPCPPITYVSSGVFLGIQWNTYGDLPNSDLLRRYGHVDLLTLPGGGNGNPGDIVEVRADLVVAAVSRREASLSSDSCQERIDWWLEEGGDE